MKLWVVIDDTNGVFEYTAYRTESEAKVAAWDAIQGDLINRDYAEVQEIVVKEDTNEKLWTQSELYDELENDIKLLKLLIKSEASLTLSERFNIYEQVKDSIEDVVFREAEE